MGIFDNLLSSGLGGSPAPITAENPVNGTVWTSSQNAAPNPFFQAMNQQTVQEIQMVGNGSIGSVLAAKGIVSGPNGSIINATLDFFLSGSATPAVKIPPSLQNYSVSTNFIPIIIKTEFNYMTTGGKPAPLYILFDSTPENVSFSKSANWASTAILGRPEPVWTYSSSSASQVSIVGDFFVNSASEHNSKLKVSDYIMALASPSKYNFMPSPVQVMIGEWKNFRAIVTQVTIDFKGPWKVRGGGSDFAKNAALSQAQAAAASAAHQVGAGNVLGASEDLLIASANVDAISATIVPTHAPYHYRATIQLTLVSKENEVQYAEDVINSAGTFTALSADDMAAVNAQLNSSATKSTLTSGAFTMGQSTGGYTYNNGMMSQTSTYTVSATPGFSYASGDSQRQSADLGIITNAVSSQLAGVINKKL